MLNRPLISSVEELEDYLNSSSLPSEQLEAMACDWLRLNNYIEVEEPYGEYIEVTIG